MTQMLNCHVANDIADAHVADPGGPWELIGGLG